MPFYLALDAGGTATECALADEHRILARLRGGSIKLHRVGSEQARSTLQSLLADLAHLAGVPLSGIRAACAGMSGYSVPGVEPWLRHALEQTISGSIFICGDDEIALDAAFPGAAGIMVISGTGSNTVARSSTGERVNVGGWGPVLGDEGSGYWIGVQALRAAFRARDRGQPTLLLGRVAASWNVDGLWQIVERAHAYPPPDFAALSSIVNACAEEGDAVSLEVLTLAGEELAASAVLALGKLRGLGLRAVNSGDSAGAPPATPSIAFAGSVLCFSTIVREQTIESLRRMLPGAVILSEPADPILGALWRARLL